MIHLATAAVVNAIWDLWAKTEGKPLWKLLADMTPEALVGCIDFRYITDAITPAEAIALLRAREGGRAAREAEIVRMGYPAYTTSVGWIGYAEADVRARCREAIAQGWSHFKIKVGADRDDDRRRAALVRAEIGSGRTLMMDANGRWGVEKLTLPSGAVQDHVGGRAPEQGSGLAGDLAEEVELGLRKRARHRHDFARALRGGEVRDEQDPCRLRGRPSAHPAGGKRPLVQEVRHTSRHVRGLVRKFSGAGVRPQSLDVATSRGSEGLIESLVVDAREAVGHRFQVRAYAIYFER